ncbi:MAG TPA: exopolysaccharide biosynthesis polyprenyl glycosylphosphotransferase [Rhodopila sp.]
MQRVVAHYLPREMAVLGLVELMLSFAMIDTVIQATGTAGTLPAAIERLPRGDIALAIILALVSGGVALTIGLYRPEAFLERKKLLSAAALTAIITFTVLLLGGGGPPVSLASPRSLHMAELIAAWLGGMTLVRLAYGLAIVRSSLGRRVLILGDPRQVGSLRLHLRSGRGRLFRLVQPADLIVSWPALRRHGIWGIVMASEPEGLAVDALLDCKLRGMNVLSGAAFRENYLGRIDLDALTANQLLLSPGFTGSWIAAALKRLCDLTVGIFMLLLLLPLMAVTAVAIKCDSRGPVFYRQQRVGLFGRTFTLFKFRSMSADAEASGDPRWAQRQDPRITRVGRFIRATRIDELPQLANVIRGEMSLVGPRPERPHFVEQLARAIPFYRQRAYVKPGLTGWAQVNFPYGASVEDAREKLAYDLYYVKHRGFLLDIIILVSTIRVVLSREGAR